MKKALKAKWLKALRSGEYVQGCSHLIQTAYDADQNVKHTEFCCLGVLADVMGARFDSGDRPYVGNTLIGTSEKLFSEACGLEEKQIEALVDLNDTERKSFKQIARWIKKHV